MLDYGMPAFDVIAVAVPRMQCTMRQTVNSAILVEPGASRVTQLFADSVQDPAGIAQAYSVNVSRLRGDETRLHWVGADGSFLQPSWDSGNSVYTVYLVPEQEYVKLTYQRLDNGQFVWADVGQEVARHSRRLQAEHSGPPSDRDAGGSGRGAALLPRAPAATPAAGAAARASPTAGRRLQAATSLPPAVGEVQRTSSSFLVSVDVGHDRMVDLIVKSADGRHTGKYRFLLRRPSCPEDRRFFDPRGKVCTESCDEGYFGSASRARCARCVVPGCAVCEGGLGCFMCLAGLTLQSDGSCGAGAGAGSLAALGQEIAAGSGGLDVTMVLAVASAGLAVLGLGCAAWCSGGGCAAALGFQDDDEDDLDSARPHSTARSYYSGRQP